MRTFVLDRKTLLQHRAGQVLALATTSLGRAFAVVDGPRAPEYRYRSGARVKTPEPPKRPRSVVSVIDVFGPLSQRAESFCGWIDGYDSIVSRVSEELSRPEVAAIVLRIDSPGGDAAGVEEAIATIVSRRNTAAKPIATYVDELAASAAYWIAAGVSDAGVYAPPAGFVGSVGCYTMLIDETQALEQEGIAVTIVRDPPGKDAANPLGPVLDVALPRETETVRAIATRFTEAVAAARKTSPEAIRALNAAVLRAVDAQAQGLLDGVGSLEQTIARVMRRATEMSRAATAQTRANARRTEMMTIKRKIEDGAAPAQEPSSGRATASEVSQASTECATACTDCAAACDGGTADEAIAATEAMIAACENSIKVGKSFLGSGSESTPKEDPMPEPAAARDTRVISLLESIERERAEEKRVKEMAAIAEERKTIIAARQVTNKEVRAWLEDPATPIQSVRDACRVLPPAQVPNLAADVTATGTVGAGHGGASGLSERELAICKETGCAPEKFAALKAQREAARAGVRS